MQFAVSFLATVAFAVLFHVPRKEYVFSGLTGAVGWVCYLAAVQAGWGVVTASFLAALVLTVLCRVFAVARKTPITIFLICGIFPLVPGAGIYYTAYYFIMGQNTAAADKGIETAVFMAIRIILLIVSSSLLTYTTSPTQLTDALERLMSPLKVIKVPVHSIAMMMTIALRFIPTLVEEIEHCGKNYDDYDGFDTLEDDLKRDP